MCSLAEVLIKTINLKRLNISANQMDYKSTLSIAFGLTHTQSLEHLNVSGNPIGKVGMKMLLQAMNDNKETRFTINMKDISIDK